MVTARFCLRRAGLALALFIAAPSGMAQELDTELTLFGGYRFGGITHDRSRRDRHPRRRPLHGYSLDGRGQPLYRARRPGGEPIPF